MGPYQDGRPKCGSCCRRAFTAVITHFSCEGCGKPCVGRSGGKWKYCDSCGNELSKCVRCGTSLSPEVFKP